jgi:hypothetical protein
MKLRRIISGGQTGADQSGIYLLVRCYLCDWSWGGYYIIAKRKLIDHMSKTHGDPEQLTLFT